MVRFIVVRVDNVDSVTKDDTEDMDTVGMINHESL